MFRFCIAEYNPESSRMPIWHEHVFVTKSRVRALFKFADMIDPDGLIGHSMHLTPEYDFTGTGMSLVLNATPGDRERVFQAVEIVEGLI